MKKVLFVLYYLPPMGGSGVQRPLKFLKYLREYGWDPIVVCPETGSYSHFDHSLEKEFKELDLKVYRVPANTPFHLFSGSENKPVRPPESLLKPIRYLSRLITYPDNKKAWIEPALSASADIFKEHKIDLVFSSAPPFSNHVIASNIGNRFNVPVVLDYRDLYSGSHFHYSDFRWQRVYRKKMEKDWLQHSNAVTVLDTYAEDQIAKFDIDGLKIRVIPHGFDPEDILNSGENGNLNYKSDRINLLYSGLFYEANQPDLLLRAVSDIHSENNEELFHLHFQGGLEMKHKRVISSLNLDKSVTDYGYLDHSVAVANLMMADVLWVMDNFSSDLKQVKSGKLFEYLGTHKPILGISHPGEMVNILKKYNSAYLSRPDSVISVKKALQKLIKDLKSNNTPKANTEFAESFNRRELSGRLAKLFNESLTNS